MYNLTDHPRLGGEAVLAHRLYFAKCAHTHIVVDINIDISFKISVSKIHATFCSLAWNCELRIDMDF